MVCRIILFAHVLFAFLYMLAHGSSVAVAFRVRRETSAERVRTLLDLSRSSVRAANYMLLSLILCGVALGFLRHAWRGGWIWLSIAILVLVLMMMARGVVPHFHKVRSAIGLVLVDGDWQRGGVESSPDELARTLASGSPAAAAAMAMGGWAVIVWLMLFKSFLLARLARCAFRSNDLSGRTKTLRPFPIKQFLTALARTHCAVQRSFVVSASMKIPFASLSSRKVFAE